MEERQLSRVNYQVRVENNLSSFLDESTLSCHLRLVSEVTRISNTPSSSGFPVTRRSVQDRSPKVLLEQPLPNGMAYYLTLPADETSARLFQTSITGSAVAVRAQWRAPWADNRHRYFPAPELDDGLVYNAAHHGQPDFMEENQPFWADEQTHRYKEDA